MRGLRYIWVIVVLVSVTALIWWLLAPREPEYGGKKLSVWLTELQALSRSAQANPRTPQVHALRAIGTNAIPWLLEEMEMPPNGGAWRWKLNHLLNKQSLVAYRVPYPNPQLRAEVGFRALGGLGEPAIAAILALAEKLPDCVPRTLAAIGRPAVPALQVCLTNTQLSVNVPINTTTEVFWAGTVGSLTYPDILILVPSIEAWADQSTNHVAQNNASWLLKQLSLRE